MNNSTKVAVPSPKMTSQAVHLTGDSTSTKTTSTFGAMDDNIAVCCDSGAISLAILNALPQVTKTAIELIKGATTLAWKNAKSLKAIASLLTIIQLQKIIIYQKTMKTSLDGGQDDLQIARLVFDLACLHLCPGGKILRSHMSYAGIKFEVLQKNKIQYFLRNYDDPIEKKLDIMEFNRYQALWLHILSKKNGAKGREILISCRIRNECLEMETAGTVQ
uniref:Uncharacterized protein n=1 Tax=Glossina austeni TaxID=7395 RepID=A0A1A9VLV3_GLOAU